MKRHRGDTAESRQKLAESHREHHKYIIATTTKGLTTRKEMASLNA